jgi:hypothetical protein
MRLLPTRAFQLSSFGTAITVPVPVVLGLFEGFGTSIAIPVPISV